MSNDAIHHDLQDMDDHVEEVEEIGEFQEELTFYLYKRTFAELESTNVEDKVFHLIEDLKSECTFLSDKFRLPYLSFVAINRQMIIDMVTKLRLPSNNPSIRLLCKDVQFKEKVSHLIMGDGFTAAAFNHIKDAFAAYLKRINLKEEKEHSEQRKLQKQQAAGGPQKETFRKLQFNKDDVEIMKDIVEFIYIYRFNESNVENTLNLLNTTFQKKHGQPISEFFDYYRKAELALERVARQENRDLLFVLLFKPMMHNLNLLEIFVILYLFFSTNELNKLIAICLQEDEIVEIQKYAMALLFKKYEILTITSSSVNKPILRVLKDALNVALKELVYDKKYAFLDEQIKQQFLILGNEIGSSYVNPSLLIRYKKN